MFGIHEYPKLAIFWSTPSSSSACCTRCAVTVVRPPMLSGNYAPQRIAEQSSFSALTCRKFSNFCLLTVLCQCELIF